MPRVALRILLSCVVYVAAIVVSAIVGPATLMLGAGSSEALSAALLAGLTTLGSGWILIWRNDGSWTRRRWLGTWAACIVAVGIALVPVVSHNLAPRLGHRIDKLLELGSLLGVTAFPLALALVWQQAPQEEERAASGGPSVLTQQDGESSP